MNMVKLSGIGRKQLVVAVGSRQSLVIGYCLTRFLIALVLPGMSFGMGLEVDPGEINIQNVALGQKVAVSALGGELMKLRIKNKGPAAYTYTIDILRSSQTTAPLNAGYTDIPDTSWIFPQSKEVEVPGNSAKDVELYLQIPKKKEFYNKKYQAVIEVKNKKNNSTEIFVLACQLKMLFSTYAGEKNADK